MPRLFVAAPASEAVLTAVARLIAELRQSGPWAADWRWVQPDVAHLTLKFIGEVPHSAVEPITQACAAVCARHGPVRLRLQGLSTFPGGPRARVIWAGLHPLEGDLAGLAANLEAALVPLMVPAEGRPFRPHLTLARAQGRTASVPGLDALTVSPVEWSVSSLVLYASQLGCGGAVHTPLADLPLA